MLLSSVVRSASANTQPPKYMCIYQVFNGEKMYQGSGGSHGYSREEAIQYFKHGNGLDTHRFSSTAVAVGKGLFLTNLMVQNTLVSVPINNEYTRFCVCTDRKCFLRWIWYPVFWLGVHLFRLPIHHC